MDIEAESLKHTGTHTKTLPPPQLKEKRKVSRKEFSDNESLPLQWSHWYPTLKGPRGEEIWWKCDRCGKRWIKPLFFLRPWPLRHQDVTWEPQLPVGQQVKTVRKYLSVKHTDTWRTFHVSNCHMNNCQASVRHLELSLGIDPFLFQILWSQFRWQPCRCNTIHGSVAVSGFQCRGCGKQEHGHHNHRT